METFAPTRGYRLFVPLPIVAAIVLVGCESGSSGPGASTTMGALQPTGPAQPLHPASPAPLGQVTGWRDNPLAEDLLDHWNGGGGLQAEIGSSELTDGDIAARVDTLKSISGSPRDQSDPSPTLLGNVDAATITVIGERDGITYGQWKQGPAGTLNVEFDWRFAPELDDEARAQMERAGKSWSWRLGDDFGAQRIRAGRTVSPRRIIDSGVLLEELRLDEAVTTGDLLIFVDRHDGTRRSFGNWSAFDRNRIGHGDFEPVLGAIRLGQFRFDEASSRGNLGLISIMAHEIGHVLGITDHLRGVLPGYESLIDERAGTFNGQAAVEANNGVPVPFQWLDGNRQSVAPGTPGSSIDRSHPGPCNAVMSYCRGAYQLYRPTELDFGFLADIGYEVLDAGIEDVPEVYGLGAWGRYSAWGAGVERAIRYDEEIAGNIKHVTVFDSLRAGADAFGVAPAGSFSDGHASAMPGHATWSGSLIGVDLGSPGLPPVFGDAELSVALTSLDGTARFENLVVFVDGETGAFRAPDLEYAIGVTGNSFADSDNRIRGSFFGPGHEEAAGVLHDPAPGVNLLAGFGGAR